MLSYIDPYISAEHRERFKRVGEFKKNITSDEIRRMFDSYIDNESVDNELAAAAYFFIALNEWCGLGKR